MNKKSQSEIMTTILIILLVLAAIVIVYQVIKGTLNPTPKNVTYYYENATSFCEHYNMNLSNDFFLYCYNEIDDVYSSKQIFYYKGRYYFKDEK